MLDGCRTDNVSHAGRSGDAKAMHDGAPAIVATVPGTGDMGARKQFIRYALVGLGSNAACYLIYLLATWLGVGSKTAMTLLYLLGTLQTFVFNKQWSFKFDGKPVPALLRYAAAYGFGYIINLLGLIFFVDHAGMPHQLVQGAMIVMIAVMLFVAQRYWVFPGKARRAIA